MKYLLTILIAVLAMQSCDQHHARKKQVGIHSYVQHNDADDTDLWLYVILNSDNSYYYHNSSTPVTNFSTVNWTRSTSAFAKPENMEEKEEIEVESNELEAEVSDAVDAGSVAGVTEEESEAEAGEGEGESSGDSDGGSDGGDGGGGDGGGGDGGGGGD